MNSQATVSARANARILNGGIGFMSGGVSIGTAVLAVNVGRGTGDYLFFLPGLIWALCFGLTNRFSFLQLLGLTVESSVICLAAHLAVFNGVRNNPEFPLLAMLPMLSVGVPIVLYIYLLLAGFRTDSPKFAWLWVFFLLGYFLIFLVFFIYPFWQFALSRFLSDLIPFGEPPDNVV